MKNYELYSLLEGIKFNGKYPDGKFQVNLMKNEERILDELKKLESIKKFSPEFEKFKTELSELLKSIARKDADGNPIVLKNENPNIIEYDIPDNRKAELSKRRKSLIKKHKTAVDEQEKKEKEFIKLMNEDCDITFIKIPENKLPSDIDGDHLRTITKLVEYKK